MRRMGLLVILALVVAGCGTKSPELPEMLTLERVPETVMKAARNKLPDVKFDTAWTKKEDGHLIYEVRGKTATGKTREVEVTPEGDVIAVE